jgi:pyruvate dehydrogenase E2 component (dihydrolipoamide acetyltransferase)
MKELKFVDVGEGITEGHIRKWLVLDGSIVKEDQPIVRVETDKAIVEVPAPADGKVKVNAKADTDVHLGDTIAYIGTDEELAAIGPQSAPRSASAMEPPAQEAAQPDVNQPTVVPREVLATPSVRKLARELGVNIVVVTGSGPAGRITEADIQNATKTVGMAPASQELRTPGTGNASTERIPLTQMRKAIARTMEESWKIPRAVSMDIMNAMPLYKEVARRQGPETAKRITVLPFIIKATIEALKENPAFNASYDAASSEIVLKKYYNIGLAAESSDGLRVVVIKNADKKSITEIATEIKALHDKISGNRISLDEMRDSTFTITNIGSLGGGYLSVPMINPPEVAILGVHLIKDAPVVENGALKVGKLLPLSLSFDHRVVDGADAVKLMNGIMRRLEDKNFLNSQI